MNYRTPLRALVTAAIVFVSVLSFGQVRSPEQAALWLKERIQVAFDTSTQNRGESLTAISWHYVFLFNSANAESSSAYTEFVKTTIDDFLDARIREGDSANSRVSFYPYQADRYSNKSQCVVNLPLDSAAKRAVDMVFPTVHFKTLADGVTPYSSRGGHDNVGVRHDLLTEIGDPDQARPVVVIQFTDTGINELPGDPKDELVRSEEGRLAKVEDTDFRPYEVPNQPFEPLAGQKVHVWIYGPSAFKRATPEKKFPWLYVFLLVGVLVLCGGLYLLSRFLTKPAASFSVELPSNGPIVVGKKEAISVRGPGSDTSLAPGENAAFLRGDRIPDGELFRIHNEGTHLKVVPRIWRVSDAANNPQPILKEGENQLHCEFDGTSKTIRVQVSKLIRSS